MKKLLLIICLFTLIAFINAQNKETDTSDLIDPTINKEQNQFLNQQAEILLSQANQILSKNLPNWPEPANRRSALLLIDGVLHDVYAPFRPPIQDFLKKRINIAANEIEQTKITNGARIWKLYNHGFIIRTKSVTIGFDLVNRKSAGIEGFFIENKDMKRLIDQCDILFVSHYHDDHADEWVAQEFINQGKPVVTPDDVWKNKSIYPQITHLERIAHKVHTLTILNIKLKVVAYPGHQGPDINNNVYLVTTPEGFSFLQMGDQYYDDDFQWIDEIGINYNVDVLMPNCWTNNIARVAKGINPSLIITGHENEMGHTIDHREPNWLTYQRQKGSDRFGGSKDIGYDTPMILMTWGESYHYKRSNFKR